jgi:hypothetical protein
VPEAEPRPDGLGRDGEADGLAGRLARPAARAVVDGLAEVPGLAERLARPAARAVVDGLAEVPGLAAAGLDGTGLVLGLADTGSEASRVGVGGRTPGAVAGLNVATDSIAPATRQTARILASNGMIAPCPASGPASRRSRLRRRFARCSR